MITGNKVELRNKRLSDARKDYTWQTDPELIRFDAAQLLTVSFPGYLLTYISELHHPTPNRHALAIDTPEGKHIGNCMYYNVDETNAEAEVGIMIGDRNYQDRGYGTDAMKVLVNYVFQQTDINRLYLKTLDWNIRAQACFMKCGFMPCGRLQREGYSFILMELYREQWEKQRKEGRYALTRESEQL